MQKGLIVKNNKFKVEIIPGDWLYSIEYLEDGCTEKRGAFVKWKEGDEFCGGAKNLQRVLMEVLNNFPQRFLDEHGEMNTNT